MTFPVVQFLLALCLLGFFTYRGLRLARVHRLSDGIPITDRLIALAVFITGALGLLAIDYWVV